MQNKDERHQQVSPLSLRRDGRHFEDIIELLLPKLYSGQWKRTPHSWDRGRDFWRIDKREKACAECKNYSKNLSIRVISPTLVMAVIDEFDRIIFFSASELNRNAKKHLAQFQQRTGKIIEIFHARTLKHLLEKYSINFQLPESISHLNSDEADSLQAEVHVSRDPDVEYLRAEEIASTRIQGRFPILLLETFCIDVFLYSENPLGPISGKLKLEPAAFEKSFKVLNRDLKENSFIKAFTVSRAGVFTYRIYFKAMRQGTAIRLPVVDILLHKAQKRQSLDPGTVSVSSLLRTPLIGKNYQECLHIFDRLVSFRDKPVFLALFGPSGSGKTRLLYELRDHIFSHGHTLYAFRGEPSQNTSFNEFARSFVAKRYRLPRRLREDEKIVSFKRELIDDNEARPNLADSILYDHTFSPSDHFEACCDLILQSLEGRQLALVVDDVQGFDEQTSQLLSRLLSSYQSMPGRIIVLLCFNTEFLQPVSKASLLLKQVQANSKQEDGQCLAFPIDGFSRDDTLVYLDHCLSAQSERDMQFSDAFPETANFIAETILNRPLYLEQTFLFLENREILERRVEGLYVKDITKLHSVLEGLPHTIEDLLGRRWKFLKQSLGADVVSVLRTITLLVRIPRHLVERLHLSEAIIDQLIDLGVLQLTEKAELVFYHQTLFAFFRKRLSIFRGKESRELLGLLKDEVFHTEYFYQYFILAEGANALKVSDVREAGEILHKNLIQNVYLPEFISCFDRAAAIFPNALAKRTLIGSLDAAAYQLRSLRGLGESFDFYHVLSEKRLRNFEDYTKCGHEFFHCVLRYSAVALSVRRDEVALSTLTWARSILHRFTFPEPKVAAETSAMLANRLCVALRSMSRRDEALEVGRESLTTAESSDLDHLVMQAHIDIGYVFYGLLSDKEELLQAWQSAVKIFPRVQFPEHELITNRAVGLYHTAHVHLLRDEYESALVMIEREAAVCASELDIFHEVKLLLLGVVTYLLRSESSEDNALCEEILEYTLDRCIRFGANQSYWVAFYALAKVSERKGDLRLAVRHYYKAFEQLTKAIHYEAMEWRFRSFFEDFALANRKYGSDVIEKRSLRRVRSLVLRREILKILSFDNVQLKRFLREYRPISTYHAGNTNLPCP